ncbi:MAG: nucleotide sugar dehydrogenase [Candidatus Omnitrophota bacterium]
MDDFLREFENGICRKEIRLAVVGLGYVGLPLAVEFAKKGFSVLGIELDKERINRLKNQESYITDVPTRELKQVIQNNAFRVEGHFQSLREIDVILICVPTPLKRKYLPDISFIKNAVKAIAKNIKKKALIILESTTYPGTTEEIILPILEAGSRKHGEDFYLCFSPERIDPGNIKYPLNKIPKVIGGLNSIATALGVLVYKNIVKKVVPVSSSRVAETVKLLENTFRLVNIGLIDEIAMMAHKMNIDIWEVIEAAKTKPFGFMPFYPGPGVGGHCIPKDPLYLYWKAKHYGFMSRFIKLSSEIINYMPLYVVERLNSLLDINKISLQKSRILLLGVSYKKDVLDLRKSPALDILEILQLRKIDVSYYDPLIPYLKIGNLNLKSVGFNTKTLRSFDCVVITSDHSSVDYSFLLKNCNLIFDTRNVYKNIKDKKIIRL